MTSTLLAILVAALLTAPKVLPALRYQTAILRLLAVSRGYRSPAARRHRNRLAWRSLAVSAAMALVCPAVIDSAGRLGALWQTVIATLS